ncbi:MlaE family ABC transporter permease [Parvularcula dongshanensis]|uniref:Phospholipid/cholesterol/gamma-HCH transport system permease protein n=1 Tax=Parvularcula dongshanensis TaxID=1173995 RepID=A0A840HZB2_9PROT|nr:ABC transporter permease [Parvularcula dongshanensis]MBB4657767.1 phospholipid/cholesterol/gamma-HCH transport system permease protein [Parvularcula dongshanensis]
MASFEATGEGAAARIVARGTWTLECGLADIDAKLRRFASRQAGQGLSIDLSELEGLDTSGAMVMQRTMRQALGEAQKDALYGFIGASDAQAALLEQASRHPVTCRPPRKRPVSVLLLLERIGQGTENVLSDALNIISFVGAVTARIGATFVHPHRFRPVSMVSHMESAGLDATLIVGLMSFLIGAVVAFMGATVLAAFGAEVFAVELVGISVLREFGVLLTAILVAGRSGSAFTAAIGSMKLREEIDAMRVMGINPLDALVIPRVLALVLTLPVLAFLAAFLGMLGGGLAGWLALDIPPALFVNRTQEIVTVSNLVVGLVKAPFFAFVIAVVGCYHGMNVESSAEELGRRTTMAVVQSLFLVILIDALFAMFFMEIDV